jgi:hypothetical protein
MESANQLLGVYVPSASSSVLVSPRQVEISRTQTPSC